MRQNKMYNDFHRFVRVVYRYYRRTYGKEATQDECLELFKIVFPAMYQANNSDDKVCKFTDKALERMDRLFKKWNPEGPLKLLCEYTLSQAHKEMAKDSFIPFCNDILPVIMRIRKLTPRECGRLMGVDEADINIIENSGVSKSAQYKLYGNSIVVDVLFFVYQNLFITPSTKEGKITPKQLSLF